MQIFLNDRLLPEQEALVSVFDHGFLYGDGVYETMRGYDGEIFMLDRHLERLFRSASLIGLNMPSQDFVRSAVNETVRANELKSAYVRVTVSRGKGPIGLDPALCPRPTFVVIAEDFKGYPEAWYREGVTLIVAATRRNLKEALDPKIKSLNFLNNILARIEAKKHGAYEALMLNADGYIAEGTVSNIFFVKENVLQTPSVEAGVLDGITRGLVLELAADAGMQVREGLYRVEDLCAGDEVFMTNTTTEVMPVCRVNETCFQPGEAARQLRQLYAKRVGSV